MKLLKITSVLFITFAMLWADTAVEITDITLEKRPHQILNIIIEIKNISNKEIDELIGYLYLYDESQKNITKIEVTVLHNADIPLKSQQVHAKNTIIKLPPNLSGNTDFRIKTLRFAGDKSIYTVCPKCGELILLE